MRFFAALLFIVGVCLPPARAETAASAVTLDNLTAFDEAGYDWPGARATGKPLATRMTVRPGYAESPIKPFGDCVYVDNRSGSVMLSFETGELWKKFKETHPEQITLTPCCPRSAVQNPCGENPKVLKTDRAGSYGTIAFSTSYVRVYQCVSPAPYRAEWKLVGENTMGGCPRPEGPAAGTPPTCPPYPGDTKKETFPDGAEIVIPDKGVNRNLTCMKGNWQQTSWWRDGDAVRHTDPAPSP